MILAIFTFKSPLFLLPSFESITNSLSVQQNKLKIDFQYDDHGGYLGLLSETIFDKRVALIPPTKLQVNWPLRSG